MIQYAVERDACQLLTEMSAAEPAEEPVDANTGARLIAGTEARAGTTSKVQAGLEGSSPVGLEDKLLRFDEAASASSEGDRMIGVVAVFRGQICCIVQRRDCSSKSVALCMPIGD